MKNIFSTKVILGIIYIISAIMTYFTGDKDGMLVLLFMGITYFLLSLGSTPSRGVRETFINMLKDLFKAFFSVYIVIIFVMQIFYLFKLL